MIVGSSFYFDTTTNRIVSMEFTQSSSVNTLPVGTGPETLEAIRTAERVAPVSFIVSSCDEEVKAKTNGEEPVTEKGTICCDMCQPPFICERGASDCICHLGQGVMIGFVTACLSCIFYLFVMHFLFVSFLFFFFPFTYDCGYTHDTCGL